MSGSLSTMSIHLPIPGEISRIFYETIGNPENQLITNPMMWVLIGTSLILGYFAIETLWRVLRIGVWTNKNFFQSKDKETQAAMIGARRVLTGYLHTFLKTVLEMVVVLSAAVALVTVGYMLLNIAWYSYRASPVGHYYGVYFPHRVRLLEMVLGRDLLIFPLYVTCITFGVGMAFSSCCKLLFLTRFLYLSRGWVGKIIFFALPLNGLAALAVQMVFPIPNWYMVYAVTLFPTLIVFSACFRFTWKIVPELGIFFFFLRKKAAPPLHVLLLVDQRGDNYLEFDPLAGKMTGNRFPVVDGIEPKGRFLTKSGHAFILYRYGHDVYFQVDDQELLVQPDMSLTFRKIGRFYQRFELHREKERLFRMTFAGFGGSAATTTFFQTFENALENRSAYENSFMAETAPPCPEETTVTMAPSVSAVH